MEYAVISEVNEKDRGKILTLKVWCIHTILASGILFVTFFVGVGVPIIMTLHPKFSAEYTWIDATVFIAGLFLLIFLQSKLVHKLSQSYLKKVLFKAFNSRSERLIKPNQKFEVVEYSPRYKWGNLFANTAEDIGLLRFDCKNKLLIFEGDQKVYQIPATAITSVNLESYYYPNQNVVTRYQVELYVVILGVKLEDGYMEFPLCADVLNAKRIGKEGVAAAKLLEAKFLKFINL